MANKQIKQLNETVTINSSDLFVVQKSDDDQVEKVQASNLLPAASVGADKIDFGGGGQGIWYEEIARSSNVMGDLITVSSIPARKYLKVILNLRASGGTINNEFYFNNDTSALYSSRFLNNDTQTTEVSQGAIPLESGSGASGQLVYAEIYIVNDDVQKLLYWTAVTNSAAGAATAPVTITGTGKYASNTLISSFSVINASGTGDFDANSEVIVLGHD